mgnify:CR=1 FL=1|tara:strand:- start:1456 stop:1998 length:543 start_codon:yes stop_codon:yes gene_type:complete
MWARIEIKIVRDVDPAVIGPFENADAEDGILLNHVYVDMRGHSISDARDVVTEEAQLLLDIEAIAGDDDLLDELIQGLKEDGSDLSSFDLGTAGAIFALSAAGAAPISSCNGGLIGNDSHSSQVPHILFSINRERLAPILTAAEAADVGLLNNSGHIEVFADRIPKLNAFAAQLLLALDR